MILIIIILTAVVNIVLGAICYTKNPKSATNKILAFLTLILASWAVANYFSLNSASSQNTLFWIRAVMFITAPLGPVVYAFVVSFPGTEIKIHKSILVILFFCTLLVASLAFTPLIFSSVSLQNGVHPTPGPGIILYGSLLLSSFTAAFVELIKKYRRYSGIEKLQLKYLLFGIIATFSLEIITNFVFVIIFNLSNFVVLGPIFSLILIITISYAVIRHKLLDIRFVVARSVAYTLLLTILGLFYTVSIFVITKEFFRSISSSNQTLISVILALFIAVTAQPLKKMLEKITDKIFFKGKYNSDDLILELTKVLATTLVLEELIKQTLHILLETIRVSRGGFIIFEEKEKNVLIHEGYPEPPKFSEETITTLFNLKRIVIFEEEEDEKIKAVMREAAIAVSLPLFDDDHRQGLLFLGEKKSGDIYSEQDSKVLQIFGPEVSVAIQNAKLYEESQAFNENLRQEVAKATGGLSHITQEVYKKNSELAEKNKTLSLLQKIDEIVLSKVTNMPQISQQVTDLLVGEANFSAVGILLLDNEKKTLDTLAVSDTLKLEEANPEYKKKLNFSTSLDEEKNLIIKSIKSSSILTTSDLASVLVPDFTAQEIKEIQEKTGIKTAFVFPLVARGEVIGAMVICIDQSEERLYEFQKELMTRLVELVGIAVYNGLLYREIQDANERLKVLDKLKNEFVSVASHELRTPMTAIKSYLWMALAGKGGDLNEKQKYYVQRSYNSVDRLVKLVNDMLNISRIESGRLTIDMKEVDLRELTKDIIEEITPRAQQLGITVNLQAADSLPKVIADPDKIKEVLFNLIGNSLKFTQRDGKIDVTLSQNGDMVETKISDNGVGLEKDDLPKLFQKFGLLPGSYVTNQPAMGTGLGLYICKSIIDIHQGKIWVTSEGRGKGAQFTFSLKVFNKTDFETLSSRYNSHEKENIGLIHTQF